MTELDTDQTRLGAAPPAPDFETLPAAEDRPRPPATTRRRRRLVEPLRQAWYQLTSMRTALLLLVLLALAAVPGSLLPQRGVNPVEVDRYFAEHPDLAPLLDRLYLFDVFAAPWFAAVYLALFVSLIGCVLPRLAQHLRQLRQPPPAAPRHLDRLATSTQWHTELSPTEAAAATRSVLRSRRWRVVRRAEPAGTQTLAAEKGYLRETGNLVFHGCLVVVLAGVAMGGLGGYSGSVLLTEGEGFANTISQYDDFAGSRLFDSTDLPPFSFTLKDFRAGYQDNGAPLSFAADVSLSPSPEAPAAERTVRVNHPIEVDGSKVYLLGHGYAPRFRVVDGNGDVAFDGSVPCLPQDASFASKCVVKAPAAGPEQLGFDGFFLPTAAVGETGFTSSFPEARRPAVTLVAYRGDLGLDSGLPQSVYSLDERLIDEGRLEPVAGDFLRPGDTLELPGGGSVTFTGYAEWATFQIAAEPGKPLVLAGAVGVVIGLLATLRVRRRRLWLRLAPAEAGGTVVAVGGLARSDAPAFADEFADLRTRLAAAAPERAPSAAPEE